LVVTGLPPWILTIANEEHSRLRIKVLPLHANDFVLPHGRRNCEANNATDRNLLPLVRFKASNNSIKLVLRWTPIALITFANETEPPKCNSSEIDGLNRSRNAVNSGSVREDCFDVTQVHSDGDRAGTFGCSLFAKLDQPLTIKFSDA
jgi:hypothetical protein